MTRLIIDTDPGIDDAVAILLAAASPELSLAGLVSVAGNVPIDFTTRNLLGLVDLLTPAVLPDDIPVACGAASPLADRVPATAEEVHGANGVAGHVFPESKRSVLSATALYATVLEEAPTEICAIGPLTNLAQLVTDRPDLATQIPRITLMGGGTHGNMTPAAEFNVFADPEAASVVLGAGIPITMVGLDVTERALIGPAELPRTGVASELAHRLFMGVPQQQHDSLAVAAVCAPSLLTFRPAHVSVHTTGGPSLGATVIDFDHPDPQVSFAVDLNLPAFQRLLRERFARLDALLGTGQ